MAEQKCMLSTLDNPFNPFTQFDQWYLYDEFEKGYHTCSYLARVSHTVVGLNDELNDEEIMRAMDEIIANDVANIGYVKVYENTVIKPSPSVLELEED